MRRALPVVLILLAACSRSKGSVESLPFGPASDTGPDPTGLLDSADTGAFDTANTSDTCWLGVDRSWTTCVPTVPYDSSWGGDYAYPMPYGGSAQYAVPTRYVDLDALDEELGFAPNFVVNEYMASYKGRYGILQDHMTGHLQDVRDTIDGPLTVNSGYRSPGYNASIGGVDYSRHIYGDAADLQADGWSVEELGDICDGLGAGYVGLYEDGHTHCDWRDDSLDAAFFASSRGAAPAPTALIRVHLVQSAGLWTAQAAGFDEGEPLRRWTARDAGGNVIDSATGRQYRAPAGTSSLEVRVGGQVTETVSVASLR